MARYHNIMGGETIAVLGLLTSSITAVITHQTMADRLAAMLNYFLATLTGPGRRSFKVSNLEKYNFRPGEVSCLGLAVADDLDFGRFAGRVGNPSGGLPRG